MAEGNIADIFTLRERIKGRKTGGGKKMPVGPDVVIDVLRSKAFAEEVSRCVPRNVNFDVDRLLRVVQTQIRSDINLASADGKSVLGAVMECAEMALMPGFMGHAYLTARLNMSGGSGSFEAEVIPGYRGLIALAMRSGEIKSITSRVVTNLEIEHGLFELRYEGEQDILRHTPILLGDKGTPAMVYCLVRFKDGGFHVEPMSADEVNKIKEDSLLKGSMTGTSAWVTHEMEMWRKTPIRRAMKYLNIGVEGLERAFELEENVLKGGSQDLGKRFREDGDSDGEDGVAIDDGLPKSDGSKEEGGPTGDCAGISG